MKSKSKNKRDSLILHITISREVYDCLHENARNISRFIDSLVRNILSGKNLIEAKFRKNGDGLAEIRTQDLRHVKATS